MLEVSFRDAANQRKFSVLPYTIDIASIQFEKVILSIHGYNNDAEESRFMGKTMDPYFEPNNVGVINISWPSNGNKLEYTADRLDAIYAGPRVAQLMIDLHKAGKRVSAAAHSMGTYVLMNALMSLPAGVLWNFYSMGGDISTRECQPNGKWGRHAGKVNRGYFYYSKIDIVLGLVSRLRNFFAQNRVGYYGLPEKHPSNWFEIDSNMRFAIEKISHSGYFQIPQLWKEICEMEVNS